MIRSGVINIDKPSGWTSHDVVAKIRNVIKIDKVGHTGTLDPLATGVLPVCFGKGTRIASFLTDVEKEYDVTLRLGEETDTQDAAGKVTQSFPLPTDIHSQIPEVLAAFVGRTLQVPPMHSAIKIKGVRLYRLARTGKVIDRPSRPITISTIQLYNMDGADISFRVVCRKGTYIRTLCADIGRRLGVGGHLFRLRRLRSGNFCILDAVEVERFCALYQSGEHEKWVWPLGEALKHLPEVMLTGGDVLRLHRSLPIETEPVFQGGALEAGTIFRFVSSGGSLLAVAEATASPEVGTGKPQGALASQGLSYKIRVMLSEREAVPDLTHSFSV